MSEAQIAADKMFLEIPKRLQQQLKDLPYTGQESGNEDFDSYHEVGFLLESGVTCQAAVLYCKWVPLPQDVIDQIIAIGYVMDANGKKTHPQEQALKQLVVQMREVAKRHPYNPDILAAELKKPGVLEEIQSNPDRLAALSVNPVCMREWECNGVTLELCFSFDVHNNGTRTWSFSIGRKDRQRVSVEFAKAVAQYFLEPGKRCVVNVNHLTPWIFQFGQEA